jgi:ribonucleoside-diphosphate reductase alpha chain
MSQLLTQKEKQEIITSIKTQTSVYHMAHELGQKGVTNYRDSSRELQSLCTDEIEIELVNKYISGNNN